MNNFKIFVPLLKTSKSSDGKLRFHGIASSTVKDRHGDTITLSALNDMERAANQNLTIFLNHSYQVPEDVAGTVESARMQATADPGIYDLHFDIAVNQANDRAVKAWEAIDNGTKLGLSIGARIPDGGATRDKGSGRYLIDHVELLETSLVGVPANPRSWVEYAVKSITGLDERDLAFDELRESAGTGVPMEGIEVPADGVMREFTLEGDGTGTALPEVAAGESARDLFVEAGGDAGDLDVAKAKKPAEHTHPHAHEHAHDHTHWNGIVHSHDHAHTHAHGHDDSHEHVDDMQGSEHDHSHYDSYGDNEHPHDSGDAKKAADLSGDELHAHLDEFQASNAPDDGDGNVSAAAPQDAPPSTPETGEETRKADEPLDHEPTLVKALIEANNLLLQTTRELVETKQALTETKRDRDQAVEKAGKAISDTAALLKRLGDTPLGKRTTYTAAVDEFAGLTEVYGKAFVDILRKD